MKLGSLIFAAMIVAAPLAFAGDASEDALATTVSPWGVKCVERGCAMIRNIVIGNPPKPTDKDIVTVTAAFERSTQKPAFLTFEFASDADPAAGLEVVFAKTYQNGEGFHFRTEPDMGTQRTLPVTCDSKSCTARLEKGLLPATKDAPAIDVIDDFMHYDLFLFRYQRAGGRYTGSTPLFAFVRDHKTMMAELQKN